MPRLSLYYWLSAPLAKLSPWGSAMLLTNPTCPRAISLTNTFQTGQPWLDFTAMKIILG